MNRQRSITRRGSSLIEMLVVISVSALLMGIVVAMLVVMMDWDRNTRARAAWGGELARLADSLRDDVRLASAVASPADDTLLLALSDDERIEYKLAETVCRKSRLASGAEPQSGQVFSVGLPASWQVESTEGEDSANRPLVTVRLDRQPRDAAAPTPMPIAVTAALGADHRVPLALPVRATTSNPADEPSGDSE